jgi:hypothetical protein
MTVARYYFHIRDNDTLIRDPDGLELPDLASVQTECRRVIAAVLSEEQMDELPSADRDFRIEDEIGRVVLTVPFRLATFKFATARR